MIYDERVTVSVTEIHLDRLSVAIEIAVLLRQMEEGRQFV